MEFLVAGSNIGSSLFCAHFDRSFISVLLLEFSQTSDNLSITFATVAMKISNSSRLIASFQCELNPGRFGSFI